MLVGKMSNEDEDAVEDELEAMEREAAQVQVPSMPDAPKATAGEMPDVPAETPEERQRQKARMRARAAREEHA